MRLASECQFDSKRSRKGDLQSRLVSCSVSIVVVVVVVVEDNNSNNSRVGENDHKRVYGGLVDVVGEAEARGSSDMLAVARLS